MKKQLYLFLTLSLIGSYAYAQVDSYDISTYKTADYSRKSIDLTANGAGSLSSQYGANSPEERNFGGDINATFSMDKISRTTDQKTTIDLSVAGNYEKNSSDISYYPYPNNQIDNKREVKQNGYSIEAFIERKSLFYNKKNHFFEFSPSVLFGYNKDFEREKGLDKYVSQSLSSYEYRLLNYNQNSRTASFSISSDIGAGIGRIENVTDARHALFVLEELEKQGLLKKDLSQDQINELASVITRAKNKRQFDSRIKLIEEITSIDSSLVTNDYVDKTEDILYYTSLYDKWMYGDRFTRLSGSRFSIGLTPYYSFGEIKYMSSKTIGVYSYQSFYPIKDYTNKKIINSHSGVQVYLDFNYENPINKKFQQSLLLKATAYTQDNRHSFKNSDGAGFNGSYAWGYYPNTRTYVQISISEQFSWNDISDVVYDVDYEAYPTSFEIISLQSKASLNVYYYLSPQVRLAGYCGLTHNFERNYTSLQDYYHKYPSPYFNFSVQYSIF